MSAELTYTNSKVADMFTVRLPAWHRDGHVLPAAPKLEEAVQIINAGYTVEKRPVTYLHGDDRKESKMAFLTVRTDTGVELGHVGPQYNVVQCADAFAATLGPLLDAGVLELETGGVLRDGADAWLLGRFALDKFGPNAREVFGDETLPYALVKVNHSGRRNNEIALTFIRVVCANTLGMVEREIDGGHEGKQSTKSIGVRHTGDATAKMVEAAETLFADLVTRTEGVAAQYRMLKETTLTPAAFRALVLLPSIGVHPTRRKNWNPEAKQAETVINRYEKKGAEIVRLWEKGDGHKGDSSAWEAYNGLVQAIDHDTDLFPQRGGVYRSAGLMHGYLRDMKDNAVVELVKFAESTHATTSPSVLADILTATEARAALTTTK